MADPSQQQFQGQPGFAPSAPPSFAPSAPPPSAPANFAPQMAQSPWDIYCLTAEVSANIRNDLLSALTGTKVVLLLDDSGSMRTAVRAPGSNPFAAPTTTRWTELCGDAQKLVELVTAATPQQGVDVHFMNRPGALNITDPNQLQVMFNALPAGDTPMISSLQRMFAQYRGVGGRVLLVLVTDGEPSDGEYDQLFRVLVGKPDNFYISLVECNDNEEEMDYLTNWDTQIPRFHNQEDYGEELNLVRRVNGPSTKFTRANYMQMIVLSPLYPKYAIDIRTAGGKRGGGGLSFGTAAPYTGNVGYNGGATLYSQQPQQQPQQLPQQMQYGSSQNMAQGYNPGGAQLSAGTPLFAPPQSTQYGTVPQPQMVQNPAGQQGFGASPQYQPTGGFQPAGGNPYNNGSNNTGCCTIL